MNIFFSTAVFIIFLLLSVIAFLLFKIFKRPTIEKKVINTSGFRVGLVKFSPFSDTGGDQSFVISLLDGGGNGILMTSLHARGVTRLYAKKVKNGQADQLLSAEEKAALGQVIES